MKRYLIVLALIIVAVGTLVFMQYPRTNMRNINNGSVFFQYQEKNISTNIKQEDLILIKEIFDNKKMYKDNPSCGFSENISIILNDSSQIFCIARDTCPIIYYKNEGKFFNISEEENKVLRNILNKYGFVFPCL